MDISYSYAAPGQRLKPVSVVVGLVLSATALLTLVGLAKAGPGVWRALAAASFQSHTSVHAVAASVWKGLSLSTFNPWYWAFVAVLTIAQWFWPARRDQRSFSVDMAVDAVWFVMGNAMQFTVVAVTLGAVTVAYAQLLGKWSLDLQPVLGLWGLAIFAFVLTDLLAWASHWCHHKVRTLWRFHSVHHSQQRLNALSDNRTHVGEVVAAALIVFVPSQLLGLTASTAMGLAFIGIYYSAMLHSNIRTNLGPLKYVFMGPQPHRVHHSILPQHFERNFGTVFSWWDYLAGTMYRGYDEYPPTGIQDTNFPLRDQGDRNPWRWIVIFAKQLVYPFQGMLVGWGLIHHRHAATTYVGSHPPDDRSTQAETQRPTALTSVVRQTEQAHDCRNPDRIPCRSADRPPPSADWYDDPLGSGLRFWNGTSWTQHVARASGMPNLLPRNIGQASGDARRPVCVSCPLRRYVRILA